MEVLIIAGVVILLVLFKGLFIVNQNHVGLVELLGKFNRQVGAGLNIRIPFIEKVVIISQKITQLGVHLETKTKDNVFVKIGVDVQYFIQNPVNAHYQLVNHELQIASYVKDTVRVAVASCSIDTLFESKEQIADLVFHKLSSKMSDYGFKIITTLVVDILPDAKVIDAMNSVTAAKRQREAEAQLAEAKKINTVKQAEAEAEARALQGKGIALERQAIAEGIRGSITLLQDAMQNISTQEITNMLLISQHYDTVKSLGREGSHTIFMGYEPNSFYDLQKQFLASADIQSAKKESLQKTYQPPKPRELDI